jgi:hypothetical protein
MEPIETAFLSEHRLDDLPDGYGREQVGFQIRSATAGERATLELDKFFAADDLAKSSIEESLAQLFTEESDELSLFCGASELELVPYASGARLAKHVGADLTIHKTKSREHPVAVGHREYRIDPETGEQCSVFVKVGYR